ncbi:hypothetical protein EVAR_23594_1 [Eumeta japonica]|uniref:Uncharacterized protein n=1 Tax=Eumeta variegata TaxID=151549 RepID=A0A4C1X1H2_EUMVA|nr:hypothetical protein EVAR_23594_1 [Eumeta japonica]
MYKNYNFILESQIQTDDKKRSIRSSSDATRKAMPIANRLDQNNVWSLRLLVLTCRSTLLTLVFERHPMTSPSWQTSSEAATRRREHRISVGVL